MKMGMVWMTLISLYSSTIAAFFSRNHQRRIVPPSIRRLMSAKLESPAAERNKEPIWQVLESKLLPKAEAVQTLSVLEIAAGCGLHTQYFASKLQACGRSFRHVSTDPDQRSLDSQQAYIDEAGLHDVVDTPLPLTLHSNGIQETSTDDQLADGSFDWMICINMVHISPWSATQGLIQTAAKKLKPGGYLFLYGPYRVGGACVESNLQFEQWLKAKDPAYGVRNLEDVVDLANEAGLDLEETVEMPANNLSVLLRRK